MKVFVVDKNLKPCDPVNSAVARILLREKKATVYKHYPFVIKLKVASDIEPQGLQLKIDPGSKVTGLAIVNQETGEIIFGAELEHRGWIIKRDLDSRRKSRQFRRYRTVRYRPARYLNRKTPSGWIAPSLMSRVYNILTWVKRLLIYTNISSLAVEKSTFDIQRMNDPNIFKREYQRGELFGFDARHYLLQKYNYTCVYCGSRGGSFELDHVIPRSKGGTNKISNLVLACKECNRKKGKSFLDEFLATKPGLCQKIKNTISRPLQHAAAVNITNNRLVKELLQFNLPLDVGFGSQTSFNRNSQKMKKEHWIDAACVGTLNHDLHYNDNFLVFNIKAYGRGKRKMCQTNKYGIPTKYRERAKIRFGFQTGDIVKALVPRGKNKGFLKGRVTVRKRPTFHIDCADSINPKYMTLLQKADGYSYSFRKAA